MLLKKRKGIFYGNLLFNFLKRNEFFLVCHTNEMQLETFRPIRQQLSGINYEFKFLKRKTILNYFDQKQSYNLLTKCLNGSLAVIFLKDKTNFNVALFSLLKKYKAIIVLGFFLDDFYFVSKGEKTILNLQKKYSSITNLFDISLQIKGHDFFEAFLILISKVSQSSYDQLTNVVFSILKTYQYKMYGGF